MKNLFCSISDLSNEAAVEQFFVNRLLSWLKYPDKQIKPKTAIETLSVSKGHKKVQYKPDYILLDAEASPRWLVDAKAPTEKLQDWIGQCAGYSLAINRKFKGKPNIRYFMLTNGLKTHVYEWDDEEPVLSLDFEDFKKNNPKLTSLCDLLSSASIQNWQAATPLVAGGGFIFQRPTPAVVNAVFSKINNTIYKRDNISQAAAFHEFVKIIFLKIRADRNLHNKYPTEMGAQSPIPEQDVKFSVRWIESLEDQHANPLDVQFQDLLKSLEQEIAQGSKKRIYDQNEHIRIKPETVKTVVKLLERLDLFSIDEDLNGRLFETFLNSTMRGKALGQYFTPRSVVKLTTQLADVSASLKHVDTIIDPCCGSGGFLIEAMAIMDRQVRANKGLSDTDRKKLYKRIREDSLFGIDVGREPPIARIARINMYLHGDGGSRIYIAEGLDKELEVTKDLPPEVAAEVVELRKLLGKHEGFDVILTNPPFSKEYDPKELSDKAILDEYKIAAGHRKKKVRSNVLFLERYHDLLRPGGRVIAIIDDSVLGGRDYRYARDYIREHFIIKAVVSLPGDAFQRSQARVKTSILYLKKKEVPTEEQADVFMWYCTAVGIDDSARQRVLPEDAANKQRAIDEIAAVVEAFKKSQVGDTSYLVPADQINDRLDVKSCVLKEGRKVSAWKKKKLEVGKLLNWVDVREDICDVNDDDAIPLLSVSYDGNAKEPEEQVRETIKYPQLYYARKGDLVVSHINAVNGAICVVPDKYDGAVVSPEYTVLTPKEGINPYALWAILRSPELRAEFLAKASGMGRHRIDAEVLLSLQIPAPTNVELGTRAKAFVDAIELEEQARKLRIAAQADIESALDLTSNEAEQLIKAFKPPR
jgi:type I restriction enzyme M protein